ncbi:hypothetical protein LIER_36594 [Lithospermum erythrorhizon]|uniref:Uncharacterized protein n=1 Tax=Lithospermum erythrorhizon TaxID=34254 RepID=A0AAV3P9F0_LITER
MFDSNSVCNPIVPGTRVDKDAMGKIVDETQYKQIVGSLMYLTSTRPDIIYVTSLIIKYCSRPTELHLQVAKRIFRYLKGTNQFGIYYKRTADGGELATSTDSNYAGDIEDRKSTKFVAATICACHAIWVRRILGELGNEGENCTEIRCDNSSTIKLSKNLVINDRSKHIDVRYHFLRDLSRDGIIALIKCASEVQIADIMTKPLKTEAFQKHRNAMDMCHITEVI